MLNTISIYCKNNHKLVEVPIGSSLLDIYEAVDEPLATRPMNAQVNNKTEGLTFRCWQDKDVEFVDYTQSSGQRTYVRALCFIFSKAVHDVLPSATLFLEHPVSKGYYAVIEDERPLTTESIDRIKARMRDLIEADLPFEHKHMRTEEAVRYLKANGMEDKARLIETAGMIYTSYYELDGYVNFFYGCLTPSTGYVPLFDLVPYANGLLLRVPRLDKPDEIEPIIKQDKMFNAYKEHLTLQRTVGLNNVGDLNIAIQKGMAQEIVLVSEAMQEKQVAKIAEEIASRYHDGVRIVLISGPSSSGKTTFCKRLEVQLITNLIHPIGISLDDYFLNREDTPLDENGEYDFESLYALDLPYFNQDIKKLLAGEEIDLPSFNFETGKRIYKGRRLRMYDNSILIMEGIHGLNPELTSFIDDHYKYQIYVSVLYVASSAITASAATRPSRPYNAGQAFGPARTSGFSPSRRTRMPCSTAPCFTSWPLFANTRSRFFRRSWKTVQPMPRLTACSVSLSILIILMRARCPALHSCVSFLEVAALNIKIKKILGKSFQ